MKTHTHSISRAVRTGLLCLGLLVALGQASVAEAQDAGVVRRLVQFGGMQQADAAALVGKISAVLAQNADRGGDRYDRLRQQVNQAIYGANAGPGRTRPEYDQRLAETLGRMRAGLDESMLPVLFPNERNSAVLCSNRFGVTITECDALMAAASNTPAALPYMAPDDGSALASALRGARVNRRDVSAIVESVREVMLGVPRNLSRDARGRKLIELLEACPGGTTDRESQIRAWHVGPTEGMARCIAQALATNGRDAGISAAREVFGLAPSAAGAFIGWGAPDASTGGAIPTPAPAPQPSPGAVPTPVPRAAPPAPTGGANAAETLRQQGRAHFRGRRFPQAAAAYEAAVTLEPNDAGGHAGLAASRLAMGDAAGAALAYQQAVRLAPTNAGYFVALGRAFAQSGDRTNAISALQHALRLEPGNTAAQQGLAALGGTPPPPPEPTLPETPSRQAIITAMRPLEPPLEECAPNFSGTVTFAITVMGETGEITGAAIAPDSELAGTDQAACMESVVRSANFPRFARETLDINYPFQLNE